MGQFEQYVQRKMVSNEEIKQEKKEDLSIKGSPQSEQVDIKLYGSIITRSSRQNR